MKESVPQSQTAHNASSPQKADDANSPTAHEMVQAELSTFLRKLDQFEERAKNPPREIISK